MDELNPMVLKGFGRHLKNVSKTRGAYICNTDCGIRQIKKLDKKAEEIIFEYNVQQQLYNNGFKNIEKFELSLDGLPYYIFDDGIYTMSKYIDGIEASLNKNTQEIVLQLASMHKSAYGVKSTAIGKNEDLIILLEKRISEMSRLRKRLLQLSNRTKLEVMILKNYEYYYELCQKSIEMLKKSKYSNIRQESLKKGEFCHNNYREENLILNIDGLYIVNFENCQNNIHITDLVNIIRRSIKNKECTEQEAFMMLEEYDKVKTLTKEEKEVIAALLFFPYKFLKICNKYYNSRKNWVQNNMIYSLEQYFEVKEKNEKFLKLLEKNV